ncbi:hypothetical protein [Microlunatus sp. Y2014]|uniref:hypothetical protein n=1 Tax=Microlunatus sp. Y2014 TaxID=3418488 RepID=UPI003DA72A42
MSDPTTATDRNTNVAPRSAATLAVLGGVALAAFPLLRPWSDKDGTEAGLLAALSSQLWVLAHLLGALGLAAIAGALIVRAGQGSRLDRLAAWFGGAGASLTLIYYGAESLGLHGVAISGGGAEQVAAIQFTPWSLGVFGIGLLGLAAAGLVTALSQLQRADIGRWRWAAVGLGLGLVTYLPQYFLPPAGRIIHGLFLLVAAAVWAVGAVRPAAVQLRR